MLKTLTAIAMLALMPVVSFAANFVEGKDYKILANPTLNPAGKQIEVREFFWYGCPHCFRLDPHIEAWLKTKPADVVFVRTPAALNPVWEGNARGYYAVEMMGLVEKTHIPLFNTIHERQARIFDEASLTAFYKNYGVDPAKFSLRLRGPCFLGGTLLCSLRPGGPRTPRRRDFGSIASGPGGVENPSLSRTGRGAKNSLDAVKFPHQSRHTPNRGGGQPGIKR